MTLAAEKELEHLGETQGCADHDHDMIHELSRRLDAIWRFDQYIAQPTLFPLRDDDVDFRTFQNHSGLLIIDFNPVR